MLFDVSDIETDELDDELFRGKKISVGILRLDAIHPVVSGNKLFKLHYFLEKAIDSEHRSLLSFGGAWSNHLLATAYAGRASGLRTIGVVRGEEPRRPSPALLQCLEYGMLLKFISRKEYREKEDPRFIHELKREFGDFLTVPEGGFHPWGAAGAAHILKLLKEKDPTHICVACGTVTTLAGLVMAAPPSHYLIGVSVLGGESDMDQRVARLTGQKTTGGNFHFLNGYLFGGYARYTPELIDFMNACWKKFNLPLDFVYTAKMLYAVFEEARKGAFPEGSRIICLHTGGLQGNRSLPPDTLLY